VYYKGQTHINLFCKKVVEILNKQLNKGFLPQSRMATPTLKGTNMQQSPYRLPFEKNIPSDFFQF